MLIICLLLLGLGISGAWDMFGKMAGGRASINLFVLFLPTSLFLSLGFPGARLMTSITFVAIYVFLAVCLIGPVWFNTVPVVNMGGSIPVGLSHSVYATLILTIGSFLALLHWIIYSAPFDEHLRR